MKILHITAEALRGGCEKNCYHFMKGSSGHEHELLVMGDEGPMTAEWQLLKIKINHLHILSANIFAFWKILKQQLKNKSYDVAICWTTIRLPLQLNVLRNIPVIKVYLGNPVGPSYQASKDKILSIAFPVEKRKITLMACSQYVLQSHQHAAYFNKFKLRVSLNPVPLPTSEPIRSSHSDAFNVGMVARLDPIKDHHTVIRGFHAVAKEIPGALLHLVGAGILKDELMQFVRDEGLSDKIFFYGDVKDVYAYLRQWDLFIYATTPMEGLGSVVAEAMANGMPCVLSDLPMLRELAPIENLARWFPASDAQALSLQVIDLYKKPSERIEMGRLAFEHAKNNFGVERFIGDYLSE